MFNNKNNNYNNNYNHSNSDRNGHNKIRSIFTSDVGASNLHGM